MIAPTEALRKGRRYRTLLLSRPKRAASGGRIG